MAGGTIDIWPLYLYHTHAVTVNFAVDRYASCVIETREDSRIVLESRDLAGRAIVCHLGMPCATDGYSHQDDEYNAEPRPDPSLYFHVPLQPVGLGGAPVEPPARANPRHVEKRPPRVHEVRIRRHI